MTAQERDLDPDPSDPAEILRSLPEQLQAQFLSEYAVAVEQARHPEHFKDLQVLLQLWRLRAVAYGDPNFAVRQSSARSAGPGDVPVEQIVGWPR